MKHLKTFLQNISLFLLLQAGLTCMFMNESRASTKTSVKSGDWTDASLWSPSGVPSSSDNAVIAATHTVTIDNDNTIQNLTVNAGATLLWNQDKRITINGNFTVNGTATMNKGEITLSSPGLAFVLGPSSVFTWDPGTNTSASATLFTRGAENFSSTSTLIIKNWYNYTLALGSVITGNFGNLVMNSPGALSSIVEWNQNNEFQTHQILGTLTVDQGWVTLDKSGSISSTAIGNIVLTSVNSSFYGHNGTHPGSFTIATGSVTNNGGIFYGLNNGNGNVSINVSGNFTNIGNVKIINNSGVLNVCNGNANFIVNGTFLQSTGDTRFIYNVTTLASGTFTAVFGNLSLTGGIFMGQTGCHVSGGTSSFTINNNCTINFSSTTDKFRCTSLSSIGVSVNNAKVNFTVGGNLVFSGPGLAEFTSSASSGSETIQIGGNLQINSGVVSFNYGTSAAAHATTLAITGDLIVNGGTCFLSRNSGSIDITIGGNILISSGTLALKGNSGVCTSTIAGNFTQSGGYFYLHSNGTTSTPNPVTLNVNGTFSQSAGTFSFDDNSSNSSAEHILNLGGSQYSIGGSGIITHAGAGSCTVFGVMRFTKSGTQVYSRTANTHLMQQVRIEIAAGSDLNIGTGNLVLASSNTAALNLLRIYSGALLSLNDKQIVSEGTYSYSGLTVDSAGVISIQHPGGLYNGGNAAAISASGNMNFTLDSNSVVEYSGSVNQIITGLGNGIATSSNQNYGILKINKSGSSYAALSASNVTVRSQIRLENGELRLAGNTLVLMNGQSSGISRNKGYLYSEDDAGILIWKQMTTETHEVPFGLNATTYIPILFSPVSGKTADIEFATRGTPPSNKPFPSVVGMNLSVAGADASVSKIIDRWWRISATGITANVTLSYPATENTLSPELATGNLSILNWETDHWSEPHGSGSGVNTGIGKVSAINVTGFTQWVIVSNTVTLPIQLAYFNANVSGNEVLINWATATEVNNSYFNVERSTDGIQYESIEIVNGAGNSSSLISYGVTDKKPLNGLSYYRLKQTDFDGKFSYSNVEAVHYSVIPGAAIKIETAGPNPFSDSFTINFSVENDGDVEFLLLNSNGQLLYTEKIKVHKGNNQYTYTDQRNLEKGIYIMNLICNEEKASRKMIKE